MKKLWKTICWMAGIMTVFVGTAYLITKLVDRFGKIYINTDSQDDLPF